jgi:hypothetical protein
MKIIEMANGIAHDGRTKVDRYEWDELKARSKHMRIKITELHVDDYQRGEARRAATVEKAKHWNHAAAGAVIVGQRKDGTFWVVDGLQRTLSEALRGDIDSVDCMVFQSDGAQHEAKVFQLCNLGRVAVDSIHKYKLGVKCGDQPHVDIEKWVSENGMQINDGKGTNQIGFPTSIISYWPLNSESVKRALLFTHRIGCGEMCLDIFKGAYILITRGIKIEDYEQSLMRSGGHKKLLHDINAKAIEAGSPKNMNICAQGILASINYRKKNKLFI